MKNMWLKNFFKDNEDKMCIDKYKQMMDCINKDLRRSKCSEIISDWSECFNHFIDDKKTENKD